MSYTAREQSDYSGHPLELYRFTMGDRLWLYTSADHEVAYGDELYQPGYIKRSGFTKGGDARKSSIEIEVTASNDLALVFRTGWLTALMVMTIYRHHYEDSEFSVLWKGRIQVRSHGLFSGDIALPALVGIYAWGRTKLKQTREQSGVEKFEA